MVGVVLFETTIEGFFGNGFRNNKSEVPLSVSFVVANVVVVALLISVSVVFFASAIVCCVPFCDVCRTTIVDAPKFELDRHVPILFCFLLPICLKNKEMKGC